MPDINIIANIDKIASLRGDFAHTFIRVNQRITAEKAFEVCGDALEFASVLYKSVKSDYADYANLIKRIRH